MFTNIGKKIMTLAEIVCLLGIIASILCGGLLILAGTQNEELLGLCLPGGIALLILGPVASWIGSFLLYGLGRLIDNSDTLVALLGQEKAPDSYEASQTATDIMRHGATVPHDAEQPDMSYETLGL